jgi:hypothetical protein
VRKTLQGPSSALAIALRYSPRQAVLPSYKKDNGPLSQLTQNTHCGRHSITIFFATAGSFCAKQEKERFKK